MKKKNKSSSKRVNSINRTDTSKKNDVDQEKNIDVEQINKEVIEYVEPVEKIHANKIDIEEIKIKDIDDIKELYSEYLGKLGWSSSTIQAAVREAFFLWDKSGKDIFWSTVLDKNFDNVVRRELKFLLDIRATKGVNSRFGDYLFQIQHFRQYVIEEFNVEKLEIKRDNKENKQYEKKYDVELPRPCGEQILIYLSKQKNIKQYYHREKSIEKLFEELCTKNDSIEDIYIKVATLNDVYDINLTEIYRVAKYIEDLDVDNRLKVGDITLVMDICKVKKGKVAKNCFSFATKFCGYHKPQEYPMYDEYVEEVLKYFRDKDNFCKFEDDDLRDYVKYKGIIIDFRKFYDIEKYDYKKLILYMRQLGKEFFSEKS